MSENRFADCLTARAVLRTFRNLQLIDADDQDDAVARIRELTPPPTVSEEARERAWETIVEYRPLWGTCDAETFLDRVIDALGYTSAPEPTVTPQRHKPYHCTVCYTTGHSKDGKCVNGHDVTGTSAPASAPVVEMDATAVRRFIDGAQTLIGGLNSRITMIRDGQEWSLYSDGVDFVLRIGGTDE